MQQLYYLFIPYVISLVKLYTALKTGGTKVVRRGYVFQYFGVSCVSMMCLRMP